MAFPVGRKDKNVRQVKECGDIVPLAKEVYAVSHMQFSDECLQPVAIVSFPSNQETNPGKFL
jgi:hypothetical protein